ncbi:hypothetical protein [Azospirillum doebereinerae]
MIGFRSVDCRLTSPKSVERLSAFTDILSFALHFLFIPIFIIA